MKKYLGWGLLGIVTVLAGWQGWRLFGYSRELAEEVYNEKQAKSQVLGELEEIKTELEYAKANELEVVIEKSEAETPQVTAVASNSLPGGGYSRQMVSTSKGEFLVSLVTADSGSMRVVVDTASDGDCANNCPGLPLGDYVARNGGFAGINGGYFCPGDYPSCAGKVGAFDTMVMRTRDGQVFNKENNVYSTVPLVAMNGGSISFYGQTLNWGVGSGTGAVANYPLLVMGGQDVVNESVLDAKGKARGPRGFIGKKGGQVVIGHVHSATIGEAATVLATLGLDEALNLDGGGSSALWSDGYKVGPGRNLPVAIVLAR